MKLFHIFRKRDEPTKPIAPPDDRALERTMRIVKQKNSAAVEKFVEASKKQERDAEFARQVISDVLMRAEHLKAVENAGIQK